MTLSEILQELKEALDKDDKKEAEKCYRILAKAGMDRITADLLVHKWHRDWSEL